MDVEGLQPYLSKGSPFARLGSRHIEPFQDWLRIFVVKVDIVRINLWMVCGAQHITTSNTYYSTYTQAS